MIFSDNIHPTVERLFQRKTYYGLLEGIPNSEINKSMVENCKEEARRYFGISKVLLISPGEKIRILSPGREMAELPTVVCMAELSHYKPMKDLSLECSRLCLIWYQEDYAFPVDPEILAAIANLSWKECSEDGYL